jgi:Protein of unknown function (DUF2867)
MRPDGRPIIIAAGASRAEFLPCDVPTRSLIDRRWVETASFREAFRVPLRRKEASVVDLFFAVFGHNPAWLNGLLIARNVFASACGLEAPTVAEILDVERKRNYAVGDKIGPWPLFALSETELIAGRDNKHLDFRVSVLKEAEGETAHVVISTVCVTRNRFGQAYLSGIVPMHEWGMRRLLSRAIAAERL